MPAEEMPTSGRHFFRGLEGAQLEGYSLGDKDGREHFGPGVAVSREGFDEPEEQWHLR